MALRFVVSFGCILVVNAPQNMVAAKDFVRTGFVMTVIALALVMLLGATYWRCSAVSERWQRQKGPGTA